MTSYLAAQKSVRGLKPTNAFRQSVLAAHNDNQIGNPGESMPRTMLRLYDFMGSVVLILALFISMIGLSWYLGGTEGALGYIEMVSGNAKEILTSLAVIAATIIGITVTILFAVAKSVRSWQLRKPRKENPSV